jgi:hypothetical protein
VRADRQRPIVDRELYEGTITDARTLAVRCGAGPGPRERPPEPDSRISALGSSRPQPRQRRSPLRARSPSRVSRRPPKTPQGAQARTQERGSRSPVWWKGNRSTGRRWPSPGQNGKSLSLIVEVPSIPSPGAPRAGVRKPCHSERQPALAPPAPILRQKPHSRQAMLGGVRRLARFAQAARRLEGHA